jgi:hypothetical protein
MFLPLYVFFSDLAPALRADGQHFVFVVYVDLNVFVVALAVPWVPARFRHPITTF